MKSGVPATLGIVAVLVGAGVAARRGSASRHRYFHVTALENVHAILRDGLRGSDGICGDGVYLWDDVVLAEEMLFDVDDGVILEIDPGDADVDACDARDVEDEGDSDYYEHVGIVRVARGQAWRPQSIRVRE